MISCKAVNLPSPELAYTNKVYIPASEYQRLLELIRKEPLLIDLNSYVLTVLPHDSLSEGLGMGKFIRETAKVSLVDTLHIPVFTPPEEFCLGSLKAEVTLLSKRNRKREIPEEDLESKFKDAMAGMVMNTGQQLLLDYQGASLLFSISQLTLIDLKMPGPEDVALECNRGFLTAQTSISFSSASHRTLEILSSKLQTVTIFNGPKFKFEELGIGGLDKEFSVIFRRAFASRLFPPQVIQRLGIQHVKGMLLYGPPGNGKTLIARKLSKCLNVGDPKLVNGPDVLNRYVGQSEQNIRDLFAEAEKEQEEKGDRSKLHIIIFDEIDAICKPRGTISGSTGVEDTIVNQLLSKIDGVNSLNNIIVIGMTNRKDMIDEAVLRPGRLEVHVEIGLPNEEGRHQILHIYTKKLRHNGVLGPDVDILELAKLTKNFSGAEIESLVNNASSYAFNKQIDMENLNKEIDMRAIKIDHEVLLKSLNDIQPQFGVDTQDLTRYLRGGMIDYGQSFQDIWNTCQMLVNQVKNSTQTPIMSLLLEGPEGTGKTALAAKLALESGFSYIKFVSPENYIGYTEAKKLSAISKIFEDAYRSQLSLIVLDNIERLIDFVHAGPRFSNSILQAILVLTKKPPPHEDRRIVIIGTTNNASVLKSLDLVRGFNIVIETKELRDKEISTVLRELGVAKSERKIIASSGVSISLKKILQGLEMSSQVSQAITAETFMSCLDSIR